MNLTLQRRLRYRHRRPLLLPQSRGLLHARFHIRLIFQRSADPALTRRPAPVAGNDQHSGNKPVVLFTDQPLRC